MWAQGQSFGLVYLTGTPHFDALKCWTLNVRGLPWALQAIRLAVREMIPDSGTTFVLRPQAKGRKHDDTMSRC